MGESVEQALEETVPILQAAKRARLLSPQEIDRVVRQRRNHEYTLKKQHTTRADYLKYASFERELANLLQKRADKKKLKKKTVQLIVGKTSSRVNLVYSRAVKAFRGDVDLWLHYARHCVKTGTIRTAQKVLARAIAYRGDCERVWLAAMALHFDTCGDAKGARTLAQRALRAVPHSATLWKEYFRMEVNYLSKLIIRRLAIGLSPAPEKSEDDIQQESLINKGEPMRTLISKETAMDPPHEISYDSEGKRESFAKNSSPEGQIAEVQHDERSESSESDASEEESSSDISLKSSELSSDDDSDGKMQETERLSFWQGGVPMTIFKRACDRVSLTPEVLLDFWMIAASSPYVPPLFLTSMSKCICARFPNCIVSRLIEARADWDCARSGRDRAEKNESDSRSGEALSETCIDRNRQVQDASTKVPGRLRGALSQTQISTLSDSERKAVVTCIRDVEAALRKTAVSREAANELDGLLTLSEGDRPELQAKVSSNNDEHVETSWEKWSLAMLEHAVAQGKTDDGKWRCGDVISAVKQAARTPFRDVYHDKIVEQFLAIETDTRAIRELIDVLLATPPLTMAGLRCMITAEIRILDTTAASPQPVLLDDTKARIRRLFAKCEALPGARQDVEFWLLYLDFERRKVKDGRAVSAVYKKALRVLTKEKVALFTELHTLRNLE